MKKQLNKKCLPASYRDRLFDQYLNIKQDSLTASDYMDNFGILFIRCDIQKDPGFTLPKFHNGL